MKHFDREIDRIMMPSTFRWDARNAQDDRERDIMRYAPLVMKVVNTFNREESRVAVFNKHDIIQSGFVGLIEGYDRIIKSEGKLNVKYLELNIKGTINRYLNYQATGVAIPEYQMQKTKAEIISERIFGAWLYSFRIDDISISGKVYADFSSRIEQVESNDNEELNELLSDMMWQLSNRERDILNMSFGINMEKKSMKEMEKMFNLSRSQISRIKQGVIEKLNTNRNAMFIQRFL